MSRTILCSDLHLGHKNIHKYRQFYNMKFVDGAAHRSWLMAELGQAFKPDDHIIVTGDVAFTREALAEFGNLPGRKTLVRGNHDNFKTQEYLEVFDDVHGLWNWKAFWWSHAPIHPNELRGRINLHGHVHGETVPDARYFNLCVENLQVVFGRPWCTLDEVRYLRPRTKELEQK